MATKYVLAVGPGQGWAQSECEVEGALIEEQDGATLYQLSDGRFILHLQDEHGAEIQEVSSSGRRRVSLEEVLIPL